MRSQLLDLKKYDTDKIPHEYLQFYDPVFSEYAEKEINLLELGILEGGSLMLWRDYFPQGHIFGIDLRIPPKFTNQERIRVFEGSQTDTDFLSKVAANAPGGFDIIIDDASHMGKPTRISFWHLFDHHLKAGGIYVIEDWGTGYWGDWPDGEVFNSNHKLRRAALGLVERLGLWKGRYFYNHSFGMVGFIKQLVDEQGYGDLSRAAMTRRPSRASKFQSLLITPAMVFIRKR